MSFALPEIIRGVPRCSADFYLRQDYPRFQLQMKAWEVKRSAELQKGLSAEIRGHSHVSGFG